MTVRELITELEKLPPDLNVMAAGESADKVIVEKCDDYQYVRIFHGWNMLVAGRCIYTDVPCEIWDCKNCEVNPTNHI